MGGRPQRTARSHAVPERVAAGTRRRGHAGASQEQRRPRVQLPADVLAARGARARRADGRGGADGRQPRAPDRHAAQSHFRLRADDARGRGRHAPAAERLRSVQEQIRRVTGYIRATLDHVRRPPLAKDPVFPAAMLRRISDVSRPRLNAAGITLQLDVADELPWLLGDPVQLELALLNLINNGLEAMPDGGTLSVVARAAGTTTRIEVSDTGRGHRGRAAAADLRAVGHDQADGPRHRPRSQHHARGDRRARRVHPGRERAWRGRPLHRRAARQGRTAGDCGRGVRLRPAGMTQCAPRRAGGWGLGA